MLKPFGTVDWAISCFAWSRLYWRPPAFVSWYGTFGAMNE